MKKLTLPDSDLTVSAIGYGTADLGVGMTDGDVASLLGAFRDAGGTFVDTAHVYAFWTPAGAGSSECAIGRYLAANRWDDVVVATKGGHPGLPGYRTTDRWLDPGRVHADIEDSLGRLRTDRIDLYYLHRDDLDLSVEEIIDMLNDEIRAGTIREIAASNWSVARIESANEYARKRGLHGFVASQVEWSLAYKRPAEPKPRGDQTIVAQEQDIEFHRRSGMPLCAYASTARGFFAQSSEDRPGYDNDVSRQRRVRARELAAQKGCTPTQIALAWLMNQPFPCIPLTGTVNADHLSENLGAAEVTLTKTEVNELAYHAS